MCGKNGIATSQGSESANLIEKFEMANAGFWKLWRWKAGSCTGGAKMWVTTNKRAGGSSCQSDTLPRLPMGKMAKSELSGEKGAEKQQRRAEKNRKEMQAEKSLFSPFPPSMGR